MSIQNIKKGIVFGLLSFLLVGGNVIAATAPGTPTIGDPLISAAEAAAPIVVGVDINGTGAVAGDDIEILLAGAPFGVPVLHDITAGDISASNTIPVAVTIPGGSLSGDGVRNITARINTDAQSGILVLTLDSVLPTVTSAKITGANQITIVFSEAVNALAGDFTDLKGSLLGHSVSGISGSGTATIVLTTTGTALSPNAVGTLDVGTGVSDLAGNSIVLVNDQSVTDGQAPALTETAPVTTPGNNTTPSYGFSSNEAGSIAYTGDCSSATVLASAGSNTVAFNALAAGAHTDCTVQVTDGAGNVSNLLDVSDFTIDLTLPTFTARRSALNTIDLTFSENVTASDAATAAWTLNIGSVVSVTQPNGSGNTLTITTSGISGTSATPRVTYFAASGTVRDVAGNEVADGLFADATDGVAPTLTAVSISSNNASTTLAKVGDIATVSLTASEPIAVPTVTIATQAAVVTTISPTQYTAAFTMTGAQAEGLIPFFIVFADTPAANSGFTTSTTTNTTAVTFDRTAPGLSFSLPFVDSFVRATSLITFSDTEQTNAQCSAGGTGTTTCTSGVTTLGNLPSFAGLAEGFFNLFLTDTDPTGNTATIARSLIKDSVAPSAPVSFLSDDLVSDAEEAAGVDFLVNLSGDAQINDTLELLIGGVPFAPSLTKTLDANDISSGFAIITIPSGSLGADGAKLLNARVRDQAGNVGAAAASAFSLTLDTTAPTAAITYNFNRPVRSGENLIITATFSEPMETLPRPQITLSGSNVQAAIDMTFVDSTHHEFNHPVAAGNGSTTIALSVGVDLAGNAIVSAPTSGDTFMVDNIAPTITPVSIASNNASTTLAKVGDVVTVSFTTNDANTVQTPIVTIQGGAAVVSGGPTSWTATRTLLAGDTAGVIAFTVDVTDQAGNSATQATATTNGSAVFFDKTAPVLAVVTPVPNPTSTATPSFTFSSTEVGSMVYGGDCSSLTTVTSVGNNTVTFASLSAGAHSNCTVAVTDAAGNASLVLAVPAFTVDLAAPTVTSVTSTTIDGSYKAGVGINLTVNFSEAASSTVGLTLNTNTGGACSTGAFTNVTSAACTYTVAGGQNTSDLDVSTIVGTITDSASNATVNPTAATALASTRSIVVDTTVPTVVSVVTSKSDGFYKAGEVITFTVTMSEPVIVTGTPKIALNTGADASDFADVTGGSGTNTLTLTYTVAAGDTSADLDYDSTAAFGVAGTITDVATNVADRTLPAVPNIATAKNIVIDTTAPTATVLPTAAAGALINAAENSAGFTVVAQLGTSGAVAGDSLQLLLGGAAFPTPLTQVLSAGDITAGSVTFTVVQGQLGADGAKSITSRVVDQAGNLGTQSSALALTLDTVAPTAPVVTSIAGNNKINAAEKSAIAIVGTAEANSTIAITLTDQGGTSKNVGTTASGAGAYSATIDGTTVTAFIDGVISPSVTATDLAGNTSAATLVAAVFLDTVPPAAPVSTLTNPTNIANETSVAISGSGEGNTAATLIVTDSSTGRVVRTSTLSAGGVLSVTGINVSSLLDGTLTLASSLMDDAGNISATTTTTSTKDTVTPVLSGVAPTSSAFLNNVTTATDVSYTLSEALGAGTVVFTRTGGSADALSPQICTLAGTALASGAHGLNVADTTNGCATSLSIVDGAVYSIAFGGSDVAGNPSATTTRTNVTFDTTNPTVTFILPIAGTTIGQSVTLTATTSEAATCSSSLDGAGLSLFSTTGATSHSKSLSALGVGSHTLAVSCTDLADNTTLTANRTVTSASVTGNTATSLTSNIVLDSLLNGQADLPAPASTLALGETNAIDLTSALSTTSAGLIEVGGVVQDQSNYTGGALTNQNLLSALTAGVTDVTLSKAVRLVSGDTGEGASPFITIINGGMGGVSLQIPNNTTVFAQSSWDGQFIGPRSEFVTGTAPAGFAIDSGGNFQFGSLTSTLVFDRPVTIQIPIGLGNGAVAYKPAGSTTWTALTTTCAGTFAAPVAPAFAAECKTQNESSVKILTWHLTAFSTMHPINPPSGPGTTNGPVSGGGGGGGGGGGITQPASALVVNSATIVPSTDGPTGAVAPQVLGASTFRFTRTLALGMRGADVTELQKRMVTEGFLKVSPTGYFGPATKKAVIAFQTKYKVKPASGAVGPLTRAVLNK